MARDGGGAPVAWMNAASLHLRRRRASV